MHDFDYEAPTSLNRAVALMVDHQDGIRPLCGGTDLIDQMRSGRVAPKFVLDVKWIEELNVLEAGSEGLRVGAAVPCRRVWVEPEVAERYSALADSCRIIGGIQIQNRASVGGNLCNSSPAADTTPSTIALGGICEIVGPGGRRSVEAAAFCTGPGTNVLQPGELLAEIRFPAPPISHSGSHYRRFIPRNEMDIAVVGVAAAVVLAEDEETIVSARVALGAVAPTPILASAVSEFLAGKPISEDTFSKAAELAQESISPITDMRGTAEYRRHVAGVLTERVLKAAAVRAQGTELAYRLGH